MSGIIRAQFLYKSVFKSMLHKRYDDEIVIQSHLDAAQALIYNYFLKLKEEVQIYLDFSRSAVLVEFPFGEIARVTIDGKSIFFTRSQYTIDVCKSWPEEDVFDLIQVVKTPDGFKCFCGQTEIPHNPVNEYTIDKFLGELIEEIEPPDETTYYYRLKPENDSE